MSEDEILKKLEELERKIDSSESIEEKAQSLINYRNYFSGVVATWQGPYKIMMRMNLGIYTAIEMINMNRIDLINKINNIDERLNQIEIMFGKLEKYK